MAHMETSMAMINQWGGNKKAVFHIPLAALEIARLIKSRCCTPKQPTMQRISKQAPVLDGDKQREAPNAYGNPNNLSPSFSNRFRAKNHLTTRFIRAYVRRPEFQNSVFCNQVHLANKEVSLQSPYKHTKI